MKNGGIISGVKKMKNGRIRRGTRESGECERYEKQTNEDEKGEKYGDKANMKKMKSKGTK